MMARLSAVGSAGAAFFSWNEPSAMCKATSTRSTYGVWPTTVSISIDHSQHR
jgi:hypothetical protein